MPGVVPLHTGAGGMQQLATAAVVAIAAALPWLLTPRPRRSAPHWLWSAGVVVLGIALLPPVEHAAERSLAAHMTQHVLLLFVVAPLLVTGEQLTASVRALPPAPRARAAAALASVRRLAHHPGAIVAVAAAHGAVVLLWHLPAAYESAGGSEIVHALEHGQFLGVGIAFWWSIREVARRRRAAELAAMAAGLAFVVACGVALGLFMTFSSTPWYPSYPGVPDWGLTALDDQQAAGAVMWGTGGPAYLVAALVLLSAVVRDAGSDDDDALRPPTARPAPRSRRR